MKQTVSLVCAVFVVSLIIENDGSGKVMAMRRRFMPKKIAVIKGPFGKPSPFAKPGLPWLRASGPQVHESNESTSQSETEAPQLVTEAPQSVTKAPQLATKAPQLVAEAPQLVANVPHLVAKAPQLAEVVHSPDHVEDIYIPELLPWLIGYYNKDGTIQYLVPAEKTRHKRFINTRNVKRSAGPPSGFLIDSFEGTENNCFGQDATEEHADQTIAHASSFQGPRNAREAANPSHRTRQGFLRHSFPHESYQKTVSKRQLFGSENPLIPQGNNNPPNLIQSSRNTFNNVRKNIAEAIRVLTNQPGPAPPPPPPPEPTVAAAESVANIRQEISGGRRAPGPRVRGPNPRENRILRRGGGLVGAALDGPNEALCTCDKCIPVPRARRQGTVSRQRERPLIRELRGQRGLRNRGGPGMIPQGSVNAPIVAPQNNIPGPSAPMVGAAGPIVAPASNNSPVILDSLLGAVRTFSNSLVRAPSSPGGGNEVLVGSAAGGGGPGGMEQYPMAKIVGSMTHEFLDGFRTQWQSSKKPTNRPRQNSRLSKAVQSGISKTLNASKKS